MIHGTIADGDQHTLKVGESCIIEVSEHNDPPGIWWGTVVALFDGRVQARIDGGRVAFLPNTYTAVYSTESNRETPSVNYTVYSNTAGTRVLFHRILSQENTLKNQKRLSGLLRNEIAQTLAEAIRLANVKESE